MTRLLLLMRHAKSDWNDFGLIDKERPLSTRGRATAPIMAKWLFETHQIPNIVLCSAAIRTQQTLDLMFQKWTAMQIANPNLLLPQVIVEDRLYLASESLILSVARSGAAGRFVMVLGHNPGLEHLASKLNESDVVMPTGSVAIFASAAEDGEWPTDWGNSKMWKWRGLVKPRELGLETI